MGTTGHRSRRPARRSALRLLRQAIENGFVMPPSLAERLLDAVWDKVESAVAAGLSAKGESTLSDVLRVSDRPYGPPGIALPPWEPELEPSGTRARVVEETTEELIQLRFD